jgi:hypothetical protein
MHIIWFNSLWSHDVLLLQRQIMELGGVLARNYESATHLVMGDPQRTIKLMCALPYVKHIVNEDWLADSYTEKHFLGEW